MSLNSMLVPLLILLPPFYSVEIGLDVAVVGSVFMLARMWDALTDPIIGAISDRKMTRWGRRRPWLVAALPATLAATWFLLNPPAEAGYVWLGVWLFLFYAFWTMMFIPYQSWGAELATDFNERTRIAGYRDGASFLGYLLATLLPLIVLQIIMGVAQPTYGQILSLVGIFFAVSLPLTVFFCLRTIPEVKRGPSQPILWSHLQGILLRNKPFQRLTLAYAFDRVAMGTYFAAMPLLLPMGLGLAKFFLVLAVINSVAALLFSPAWVRLSYHIGKHVSYCVANGVTMLSYAMFFFMPSGSIAWALATFVVLGIGNAGTLITAPSMMADCVDYDHLQSGVEQTGAHMACLSTVTKIGFALGIGIGLNVVGLFGFDGQAVEQSEAALLGLRFVTGGIPMLLLILPILIMWRFPLDRDNHANIRRELDALKIDRQ